MANAALAQTTGVSPEVLKFFFALVHQESGLALDDSKAYLVETRLDPIARSANFPSVEALGRHLQKTPAPDLRRKIVEVMTTNETSFFRDRSPFDVLKSVVLPNVLKANAGIKRLRIWSGACSTGQEPYSIAMQLSEMGAALGGWDIKILATDIADHVLEKARAGGYTQYEAQRGLPVSFLVKFFQQSGPEWVIKPEVRRLVEFQRLNVLKDFSSLGTFDVIFFRNIMIYFDLPTKKQVLERMAKVLAAHGALFLGGTETPLGVSERWTRIKANEGVYYTVNPPGK